MNNLTVSQKDNWMAIKEQAEHVKKAGLLPSNMTAEQATIIILKGQELGIGAMRALEGLYVVNGKISMSAALTMGLIRERCPKAVIATKRKDAKGCIIEATRPGQPTETYSFLEADAQAAGLIKPGSPWTKYAASMYWSRCVTNMGRQLFSDILGAPYTPEELGGDVEDEIKEVNQTSEAIAPKAEVKNIGASTGVSEPKLPSNNAKSDLKSRLAAAKEIPIEKTVKQFADVIQKAVPPKEEVIEDTGEIITFDEFEDIEFVDKSQDITHWDRIATGGIHAGQSFRAIYKELGKEKFFALYQASVNNIARMQKEGKAIPQTSQDTFKDLELCLKELGLS